MTYAEFLKIIQKPLSKEEMQSTEDTTASAQEVQWWKGWQVRRAIRHKRAGNPTKEDLRLIETKTNIIVLPRDYETAINKE